MSFTFASIEHALAYAAQKIVTEAKALAGLAVKLQKYEPALEAVTAEINPQAVLIERAAFTALGLLAKASSDVGNVPANGGILNINADAGMISDFKSLYSYLATHLLHAGVTPPASPVGITPAPGTP
jgi:hypothetical protein